MSILETALRGGAVAILLLSVLLRARYARNSPVIAYSALLLLCTAAFVIDSAPGFYKLSLSWKIPIHVLSSSTPAVFWIAAAALFDDAFRARWYHGLAWLWLAALAWREMFGWPANIVTAYEVSALLCVLFGDGSFASNSRSAPRPTSSLSSGRNGFGPARWTRLRSASSTRSA
jgi:hypothetical protein